MDRSISTINADVAQAEFGARGQGIVWAVVADGVAPLEHFRAHENLKLPHGLSHWDMANIRQTIPDDVDASRSVLEFARSLEVPADPGRHGTGVSAVVAGATELDGGSGRSRPVRHLRGIAPQCKILSINVMSDSMQCSEFEVLAALQAIQAMNEKGAELRVHGVLIPLSISFDAANYACGYSPVCVEVDRLVSSGVVVVAPAGNQGFDVKANRSVPASIADPGNARHVITVGSTHRAMPDVYGPSYFSARGPTADGRLKPDLLAPGEKISTFIKTDDDGDQLDSQDGTSLAAAHVAGAAAALLSARRELIKRPLEVKKLLCDSAVDLNREPVYQGAGLLDLVGALRCACETRAEKAVIEDRPKPLRVFISYSHQDDTLWEEFKPHLSPMVRTKLIQLWSDKAIAGGTRWEPQILEELESADIVLLMVSAYFVASDYAYSTEMGRALAREAEGTARIFPVLIRPVDLRGTPLEQFQILPAGMKAITSLADAHDGWAQVATELRNVVVEIRAGK